MQKRCIWILGVHQAALSVVHEMRRRCRCRCILMLLLAYPAEPTKCGAATLFIQNIAEKENSNTEQILVYVKTETKPFTERIFFYRDINHRCTRVSHERAACLESHVKLM